MAVVYAVSEFTDEKGTDWKVKIVDGTISTGDLNHAFTLGPDGFRLTYDFDNFDRAKPIVGSRVQITLFHNDSLDTQFNTLYSNLDSAEEGTYRIEIYRDQDSANECWWVGEILPEQTIIPDQYPSAPVTLTAVDGLGNLKGIDYNNAGSAYTGTNPITGHIYNCLSKVHSSNFWGGGDVLCSFFEDFIGKEYKTYISSGQNQQLNNAWVEHNTYYNLDSNGTKQYFNCYEVLESICISFNATIFMAQGRFWFVPLGAIQSHGSNALDISHELRGGGVVSYNTSTNVTFSQAFGNNSADFEKLAGWERSSTPAFKEVKRVRDYQGDKPVLYRNELAVNTLIQDEDATRPQGQQLLVAGKLNYYTDGISGYTGIDKIARIEISITLRVGDASGTDRYLKRGAAYSANSQAYVAISNGDGTFTHYFYDAPQYEEASWDASSSSRIVIVGNVFDIDTGVELGPTQVNPIYEGNLFSFITPPIVGDAAGLQLEVDIAGIDHDGNAVAAWTNSGNATFYVSDVGVWVYDNDNNQEFGQVDITSFNNLDARYKMDQGLTLIGDRITESDLGTIKVYNGSANVLSSEWTNSQNSTAGYSINGLAVAERLAANKSARRVERGTLYQVQKTKFIHPYSILTNSDEGTVYYQVTGLTHIAARCEYDVECMFLSRDISGITLASDNKQPTKGDPWPTIALDSNKISTTSEDTVLGLNNTKTEALTTDTHGITALKVSNGSSGTYNFTLPNAAATSTKIELLAIRDNGNVVKTSQGTDGQVLVSTGVHQQFEDLKVGYEGDQTRIKILPRDFVANDVGRPLMIEDDDIASNELYLHSFSSSDCFAFVSIPKFFTATAVRIYGTNTSKDYYVYEANINTNTITLKGSATAIGSENNITDVTSTSTNYLVIRVTSAGSTDEIHGGFVEITAT
jgi:hypothetical protein